MVAQPSRSIALNDQVAAADHPGCVRRRSQISHWSSTGQLSRWVDLSPWHQDEPALVGVRMGQLEIILITLAGAHHDEVDVERTGGPALGDPAAAERVLDGERALQQGPRLQSRLGHHDGVEELRTVLRTADWFGLIDRRDIDHDDVRGIAERVDRSLQVAQAVTEIGAEGVDDLAQRSHAAEGVGIDRVGIRAAHLTYSLST